jgi:hypothetical protein
MLYNAIHGMVFQQDIVSDNSIIQVNKSPFYVLVFTVIFLYRALVFL